MEEARRHGIDERWRRRVFYTDEEDGATTPDGYERDSGIDDLSDEDAIDEQQTALESHPPSPRSRSSSKVRFQDDLTDDYDVRSNPSTSSRSIPVGERWGGFEIPEVERDVGKEILYQFTQQGFNELLDILFKPKEDLLTEVYRTRTERNAWAREIEVVEQMDPFKRAEDGQAADERDEEPEAKSQKDIESKSLEELLEQTGYSVASPPPLETVETGPILAPPSPELEEPDDDVRPTHLAHPEEDDEVDPTLPQNRPDHLGQHVDQHGTSRSPRPEHDLAPSNISPNTTP
ncbi:EF hand domain protein, partial [Aspergillus sp. HF37]